MLPNNRRMLWSHVAISTKELMVKAPRLSLLKLGNRLLHNRRTIKVEIT